MSLFDELATLTSPATLTVPAGDTTGDLYCGLSAVLGGLPPTDRRIPVLVGAKIRYVDAVTKGVAVRTIAAAGRQGDPNTVTVVLDGPIDVAPGAEVAVVWPA